MWEARYGAHPETYVYGTEPNDFLRHHLHVVPQGPVLCLADGEGRNSVFVAESGHESHAVDLSEAGVRKALRLAATRGVEVRAVTADLAVHDLGQSRWAGIVSIFAHMPPAIRVGLHRRVVAALQPGGVLLLEAYTPDQIGRGTGGPQHPDLTMTLDALTSELEGLELLHAEELVRDVVEGPGHTGPGAVVQVVARRPA